MKILMVLTSHDQLGSAQALIDLLSAQEAA
jgi:hypothetical protein